MCDGEYEQIIESDAILDCYKIKGGVNVHHTKAVNVSLSQKNLPVPVSNEIKLF